MNGSRRPWLTLKVKSPFWREVLIAGGARDGTPVIFPGAPGSCWTDADGDMWIHGDDGHMWLITRNAVPRDPASLSDSYGPMTRAGGA